MIQIEHPKYGKMTIYRIGEYSNRSTGGIQCSGGIITLINAMLAFSEQPNGDLLLIKCRWWSPKNPPQGCIEECERFINLYAFASFDRYRKIVWKEMEAVKKLLRDEIPTSRFELMEV